MLVTEVLLAVVVFLPARFDPGTRERRARHIRAPISGKARFEWARRRAG
jgi:hypothetical protein